MRDLKITNRFRNFEYGTQIFFDTESYKYNYTDKWNNIIKLKDYKNVKEIHKMAYYVFLDSSDMHYYYGRTYTKLLSDLKYLYEKHKKITVFAHNYRYDIVISGLMDYVFNQKSLFGLKLEKLIFENIFYAEFKRVTHHKNSLRFIKFLDTTNFFHDSLKDLSKAIGLEKYANNEYNYDGNKWNNYIHKNALKLCLLDTFILYKIWHKFTDNNYFVPSISTSQLAYRIFRKFYLFDELVLPSYVIEPALLSYRGGNTTLYKQHIEPIHTIGYTEFKRPLELNVYDINSLYAKAMRDNKYSIRLIENVKDINPELIYNDIKNKTYNYLLNVDYYNLMGYPNPVLTSHERLIAFDNNSNQWITGREYMYLIDNGFAVLVNKAFKFENDYLFKDYIDFFYKKKSETSGMERIFYKHLLTDLYGKFGQNKAHGKIINKNEFKNIINFDNNEALYKIFLNLIDNMDNNMFYTDLSGKKWAISKFENFYKIADNSYQNKLNSIYNNPLIASEITADARLINYDYRKLIGFDRVYYTDTDSFFTADTLPDKYISDNELGLCKLDKTGYFYLNGEKDYKYYDYFSLNPAHIVLKGISKKDKEISYNVYEHLNFNSFNSHYSKNKFIVITKMIKKRKINSIKINPVTKTEWKDINELENFIKKMS